MLYRQVTALTVQLFLLLFLTSCFSSRKSNYFNNVRDGDLIKKSIKQNEIYTIKSKDILFVSITSSNDEITKKYNPAIQETGIYSNPYSEGVNRAINGHEVDRDGNLDLPIFGKLNVAGKSLVEIENIISKAASEYVKVVSIKVKLINYKITVLGEVKVPGVYYNYDRYINVLDAISLANGTTDFAKMDKVMVMRSEVGGDRIFILNLNQKQSLMSDGYYLKPNDVVLVQQGRKKAFQQRLPFISVVISSISAVLLLLNFIDK